MGSRFYDPFAVGCLGQVGDFYDAFGTDCRISDNSQLKLINAANKRRQFDLAIRIAVVAEA